eukprot:729392-Hanusia_phi.AAC.2
MEYAFDGVALRAQGKVCALEESEKVSARSASSPFFPYCIASSHLNGRSQSPSELESITCKDIRKSDECKHLTS